MPKTCQAEGCARKNWSNHFCDWHQYLRTDESYLTKKAAKNTSNKPRKAIKKVSDRLSKQQKVYSLKRIIYLGEHLTCEYPECNNRSTDLHHCKSRGIYLNDISTWKAVCREHHDWIHNNPVEAENMGLWVPVSKR